MCIGLIVSFDDKKEVKKENEQTTIVYTDYKIKYVAVQDGAETDVYSALWKTDGNYPKGYNNGEETVIDDLLGKMNPIEDGEMAGMCYGQGVPDPINPNKDYSFYGWYLDKKCTEAFDGIISKNTVGDITLYAKISVSYWTNNY